MILNGSPMSLWASDQYLDNKASWIAYELQAQDKPGDRHTKDHEQP